MEPLSFVPLWEFPNIVDYFLNYLEVSKILLSNTVNRLWEQVSCSIGELDLPREKCVMVDDTGPAIRACLKDSASAHQLYILHIVRVFQALEQGNTGRDQALASQGSVIHPLLLGGVGEETPPLTQPGKDEAEDHQTLEALGSYVARLKKEGSVSAASFVSRSV